MDFLRNPIGADGWDEFRIEDLGGEAVQYLRKTGAMQETPVQRLHHMNPPAIEIYAENDIDLNREPLEIALCAQHMNGGFAVNKWWESNLRHTFVVGEMAGTHGVKRPGGAALNAGQVGSLRAAQYIANVYSPEIPGLPSCEDIVEQSLAETVDRVRGILDKGATAKVTPPEAMGEIGQRMTRYGAHLRSRAGATKALEQAKRQLQQIHTEGLRISSAKQLISAVVTEQQVLTHLAILKAICGMFQRGAGSRGSHCILDESGIEMHPKLIDPETDAPCRFKAENEELRGTILHVRYDASADDLFELHDVEVRPIPEREIAFEPAWAEFREGKIYEM